MPTEDLTLPLDGPVPNNPQPVRLSRAALKGKTPAQIEAHLRERGWTNAWRDGIYPFHHYHSTAHEVLVIARGQARLTLGGEGGPQVQVGEGDVLVLPAGTGHKNDGSSPDLLVIGAYAGGREWDLCRPEETDVEAAQQRIAGVPDPERDPVSGEAWVEAGAIRAGNRSRFRSWVHLPAPARSADPESATSGRRRSASARRR
ncbi:cupin domain-containing protein [Deinococcus metallilatus]|uniref:Cupin domain-containing protein n=1 Tax=Deinococcus metallilatus TaxID=1211322 RepID=A0AAJ5JYF3_9DEIO|nr:cupin domain-containing protein [Deinococcus metallilatus]MBB5295388.1 uncharacterized protein YjlB [Deinococcus metallilatus]QBY08082.1 cupin domain-containing protein [Deinococcus metallilatus]RXJ12975.1 cupin domain-containing protein [Deinococcus metallilatus]TLK27103.1 cupin domain-containing protein [Deinococcus metallilatus]GMA16065.1 hypothetical protein GCM10025871_23960 [Deinococcus metallilatus]